MRRGDQIAYIPDHAKAEGLTHPDVEFGFVDSISFVDSDRIFCRYWIQNRPGVLRTTANSEGTNIQDLVLHISVPHPVVVSVISKIDREDKL